MRVARATGHSGMARRRSRCSSESRISRMSFSASVGIADPNCERMRHGVGVTPCGRQPVSAISCASSGEVEGSGTVMSPPTWTRTRSLRAWWRSWDAGVLGAREV